MSTVTMIGNFNHPRHGTYYIYFDKETQCYGLGRVVTLPVHCGYASLEALMKAKGF